MRTVTLITTCTSAALLAVSTATTSAQDAGSQTRAAVIEQAEAQKLTTVQPYVPTRGERFVTRVQDTFISPSQTWHPFFENAYRGGGFAAGLGYMFHVSPFNYVDVRGSYSIKSYKRAEVEFVAPRLFHRRGELSVVGGWRDATEVGFYGLGMDTSLSDRANYGFERPAASAVLTVRPTARLLLLRGGLDYSQWDLKPGTGGTSVDDVYTPETLPGVGATTTYLHSLATAGFDWRPASGYARRGGFYAVTAHDFHDRDERFGFQQLDYEVIQHIPILRESWVLSLHGLTQTTWRKGDQEVPFFMLPSLGGGSNLRGYSSWRFRDRNSVLLQGEWRIMVNRFFDSAVFYDAGQVAAHKRDLDLHRLQTDYGFGVRFHAPFATVLRIDVARSREGTSLVFATSPVF
jgi:hypothetical protein